jgi:Ca-activated chloride channel family protein
MIRLIPRRLYLLPRFVRVPNALRLCASAFLLALLLGLSSIAQEPKQEPKPTKAATGQDSQEIDESDVISVSTTEILLPVTVRDKDGRLATGLTRKDFRVFEEGREQPLSDLALRQVPVDVILMIDASSSVAANIDDFRRSAEAFSKELAPEDRFSLIKFDDRVELLQDWTQSRLQLRRSLARINPGVFTRFYDALFLGARDQLKSARSRHAILVLTDGIDSGRGVSGDAALKALLQAQATVYVVSNTEMERVEKRTELNKLMDGTPSTLRFNELRIDDLRQGLKVLDASDENLDRLTAATGGRLYKPPSFDALEATYQEVANELRHQYALYYSPLNKARDGKFRRVKVETTDSSMRVSARIGYYAPRK